MVSPREGDPLLSNPRTIRNQGSKPLSFKNGLDTYYFKEIRIEDEQEGPDRSFFYDWMTVLAICVFLSVVFIFYSQDFSEDVQPIPRTFEQRVERILTDTPLIGQKYILTQSIILSLTSSRWTQ
jgi:membrane dipeptidase